MRLTELYKSTPVGLPGYGFNEARMLLIFISKISYG